MEFRSCEPRKVKEAHQTSRRLVTVPEFPIKNTFKGLEEKRKKKLAQMMNEAAVQGQREIITMFGGPSTQKMAN